MRGIHIEVATAHLKVRGYTYRDGRHSHRGRDGAPEGARLRMARLHIAQLHLARGRRRHATNARSELVDAFGEGDGASERPAVRRAVDAGIVRARLDAEGVEQAVVVVGEAV